MPTETMVIRSLIVEDDPWLLGGMVALIKTLGQEPDTAATVAEALAKLNSKPSHVLLDLKLPDGLGTEVLERIRAEQMPIRVAVISGTQDAALLWAVERLGADVVFIKPPDWDTVVNWLTA
jgi:DNA-binding response OmpR family regulator